MGRSASDSGSGTAHHNAVMVQIDLNRVFGSGDKPSLTGSDFALTDSTQHPQGLIAGLGYSVDSKQTVSAMKYAARYQPFVKKVGQQPVAEIFRLIIILQNIFDEPCRL